MELLGVTPMAKDLVSRMLKVNPCDRLSVSAILEHPWITDINESYDEPMGHAYIIRIKGLEVRKKLKLGFQAGDIERHHASLKKTFQEELPFLTDKNFLDKAANAILTSKEFQMNLKNLKMKVLESIMFQEELSEDDRKQAYLTTPKFDKQRSSIYGEDIDFEKFKRMMSECRLDFLANEKIFSAFDMNENGMVSMKHFLFALLALRSSDPVGGAAFTDISNDPAELYFHLFDIDEDKQIGMLVVIISYKFRNCYTSPINKQCSH